MTPYDWQVTVAQWHQAQERLRREQERRQLADSAQEQARQEQERRQLTDLTQLAIVQAHNQAGMARRLAAQPRRRPPARLTTQTAKPTRIRWLASGIEGSVWVDHREYVPRPGAVGVVPEADVAALVSGGHAELTGEQAADQQAEQA